MKNQIKTVVMLGVLSVLLMGLGSALGPGAFYITLLLAIGMNFVSYFWSDRIVLAMQKAREVPQAEMPALHTMVAELAQRAGIPKPRIYVTPEEQPNAFATGRNPAHGAVAVTRGILNILNERELRGVLAHELAHIRHRDILVASVAAAVATAITYLAQIVQWTSFFGGRDDDEHDGSPLAGIALALVAPIAASLIQLAISRGREYQADATGAQLCGDPEALARALEKLHTSAALQPAADAVPATASLFIVNPFSGMKSFLNWFSTHPPVQERVARLRRMIAGPVVHDHLR